MNSMNSMNMCKKFCIKLVKSSVRITIILLICRYFLFIPKVGDTPIPPVLGHSRRGTTVGGTG